MLHSHLAREVFQNPSLNRLSTSGGEVLQRLFGAMMYLNVRISETFAKE